MKKLLQKYNKFLSSSILSFSGLILILQSILLPGGLYDFATTSFGDTNTKIVEKEVITAKRVVYVTVTAYSSTPDQTDDTPFITANGTRVRDGIIAANFLPFGTKVRFPDYSGDKIYEVTDRMHERFSDRADIWFETRQQALTFGKRTLKMEIL